LPSPRVFVSSTCYDLSNAREQIRSFLLRIGYDPILSEYSDVLYDPRTHTHTSCIQEVPNADIIVLIIGSRFGGKALPEALSQVDMDILLRSSVDVSSLADPSRLSVTQLEVLKAIEASIPVFAFVDDKVLHDHFVYQRNKAIADQITFPSIEKVETAKYIFEFINFLTHRNVGNGVIGFSRIEDIENHLTKQWASLFQRLLREQRDLVIENRRIATISEQLEDLKSALISSIDTPRSKEIARGVLRYRRLLDFLRSLSFANPLTTATFEGTFLELLSEAGIVKIVQLPKSREGYNPSVALLTEDANLFYEVRLPMDSIDRLAVDWQSYSRLDKTSREVILDAVSDNERFMGYVRRRNQNFEEYISSIASDKPATDSLLGDILAAAMIEPAPAKQE
jgi:hypothetical protein